MHAGGKLDHAIGHFRVLSGLCFKTRVGAQPLIWKSFFILIQIKLIFKRKAVHLASFLKCGFWNSEVAYSDALTFFLLFLFIFF